MNTRAYLLQLAGLAVTRVQTASHRAQVREGQEAVAELTEALDHILELRRLLEAEEQDSPADRLERLRWLEAEVLDRSPRCRGPLQ